MEVNTACLLIRSALLEAESLEALLDGEKRRRCEAGLDP
jgi:hypothetical protein